MLKCMQKAKIPKIARKCGKKNIAKFPDFRMCCKVTVIKSMIPV